MESKRQRVGEGTAPPDDSSQLADVLSKLTALVTQGAGEAEGLDDLLERLGRLQGKLNGASDPAFKAIEHAQARLQVGCLAYTTAAARLLLLPADHLPCPIWHPMYATFPHNCVFLAPMQAAIVALQAAVDRLTPPPGYRPPAPSDDASVRSLLAYSHRLSYSSSAPLGYQPGQPLYFFKPPAPQEAEMRASQLHAFARESTGSGKQWRCVWQEMGPWALSKATCIVATLGWCL